MKVLVINSGSSSIKFQLIDIEKQTYLAKGLVERIGIEGGILKYASIHNGEEKELKLQENFENHEQGLQKIAKLLVDVEMGVIKDPSEIQFVGHRVVHGGEKFTQPIIINDEVKKEIKSLFSLAPLHNPANLTGIEVAEKIFKNAKQIAVFDTAFHQTMPEKAFRCAIPENLYKENGVRAYGFHGTSHKFISQKTINYLQNPFAKIISLHLGNGASIAAINAGKSVETSMGFGPLSGLVMGTRAGDIDASVLFYMNDELKKTPKEVSEILNKQSGLFGLNEHE